MASSKTIAPVLRSRSAAVSLKFPLIGCVGPAVFRSAKAADIALLLSADPDVVEFSCLPHVVNDHGSDLFPDFEIGTPNEVRYGLVGACAESSGIRDAIILEANAWTGTRLANLQRLAPGARYACPPDDRLRIEALLAECEYTTIGEVAGCLRTADPLGVIAGLFFLNTITLRIDDEPLSPLTKLAGPATESVVQAIIAEAGR